MEQKIVHPVCCLIPEISFELEAFFVHAPAIYPKFYPCFSGFVKTQKYDFLETILMFISMLVLTKMQLGNKEL